MLVANGTWNRQKNARESNYEFIQFKSITMFYMGVETTNSFHWGSMLVDRLVFEFGDKIIVNSHLHWQKTIWRGMRYITEGKSGF